MYKLDVTINDGTSWDNFINHISEKYSSWPSSIDIDTELKAYHAKNVFGTTFIEFETEEDATAFILKWS